jgi:hypothetical protein
MNAIRSSLKAQHKRQDSTACAMLLLCATIHVASAQGPPPQPPRIATIILDSPARTPRVPQLQRVLQGRVLDTTGKGVAGAVVSIRNARTSAVLSMVTGEDGSYRFVELPKTTDYEVWAEIGRKRSGVRTISWFDNSNEMRRDLTLEQ